MPIKPIKAPFPFRREQSGSSLIEVLVAILLLSFGTLSMSAMLSYAVQLPRLAAYRATASNLANEHIERIRANPTADYASVLSYDGSFTELVLDDCTYPNCTAVTLANMDKAYAKKVSRQALPAGGLMVSCTTAPCQTGELWMVWQEPSTFALLNPANADNCPSAVTSAFTSPKPRCLYVRFSL